MRFIEKIEDEKCLNLISEYHENGYLCSQDFFRNRKFFKSVKEDEKLNRLTISEIKFYFNQLVSGIFERNILI